MQNNNLQTELSKIGAEKSILEIEKLSLELEVEGLQSNFSLIENEKFFLETQLIDLELEANVLQDEKDSLETEKDTLESEFIALQSEKTTLESQITSLQSETSLLINEKTDLLTQVSSLQTTVSNLESDVISLENDKSFLSSQVSSLQSDILVLENEVIENYNTGYVEGELVGYNDGYMQGVLDGAGTGWNIRDPTYSESMWFLSSDRTDENEYTENYTCHDFASEFKNNAFYAGYRCGYVYIEFPESAHAIICFDTTDYGLLYVEPQNDQIVTLKIGEPYFDRDLYIVDFDDTIIDFDIIW